MANRQQRQNYQERKETIEHSEMSARYFKAEFETMYYTLEIEKIRGEYTEFLKSKHPELLEPVVNTELTNGDTQEQE